MITERACRAYLAKQTPNDYKITSYEVAEGLCSTCGLEPDGMNCGRSGHKDLYRHQAGVRARDSAAPATPAVAVTSHPAATRMPAGCPLGD